MFTTSLFITAKQSCQCPLPDIWINKMPISTNMIWQ